MVGTWAENSPVGDQAMAWADDRHRLLSREESILVQGFGNMQLVPNAEKPFQVRLGHMVMPCGDIHHQIAWPLPFRACFRLAVGPQMLHESIANQPFHYGAIQGCRAHAWKPSPATPLPVSPATISRATFESTSCRCSVDNPLSTMRVSMADSYQRNASACLPILL